MNSPKPERHFDPRGGVSPDKDRQTAIVTQDYWDASYNNLVLAKAPPRDAVRQWLQSHVPAGSGECLEVGCFPGRYLAVFGELGYRLHGIDLTPRVQSDLPRWLETEGFRIGDFSRCDVCDYSPPSPFDIVCSFGFIEHFANWENIVRIQASWVKPGGLLIMTAPNFRGWIQRALHVALDRRNYMRHNIGAMNLSRWRTAVESLGFTVNFCKQFGGFDFWVDAQERNLLQRALIRRIERLKARFSHVREGAFAYSPYIGLIARKSMI